MTIRKPHNHWLSCISMFGGQTHEVYRVNATADASGFQQLFSRTERHWSQYRNTYKAKTSSRLGTIQTSSSYKANGIYSSLNAYIGIIYGQNLQKSQLILQQLQKIIFKMAPVSMSDEWRWRLETKMPTACDLLASKTFATYIVSTSFHHINIRISVKMSRCVLIRWPENLETRTTGPLTLFSKQRRVY